MINVNKDTVESAAQTLIELMKAKGNPIEQSAAGIAATISYQLMKALAVRAAPCHTLPESLPQLTAAKLRLMYKLHSQGEDPGERSSQQLIDALITMIPDQLQLMAFALHLPAAQWDFFKKSMNDVELKDDLYPLNWGQLALSYGYMFLFHHDEEFVYVVPEEVKAAYKAMDSDAFRKVKLFREKINEFACAAVNLYGAMTFDEFVRLMDVYVEYGRDRLLVTDLKSHLIGYSMMNDDYRVSQGYLVSIALTDENDRQAADMEAVRAVTEARRGKPRYTPDVNTFLKYADPDHYEETKEIRLLITALVSYGMDREDASWLIDSLCQRIARGDKPGDLLSVFEENDVTLKEEQINQVIKLVTDMSKTTRLWNNFGHTSNEIAIIHDGNGPRTKSLTGGDPLAKTPDSILPLRQPNRNEPCPCGSGLKYKKCCGKKAQA